MPKKSFFNILTLSSLLILIISVNVFSINKDNTHNTSKEFSIDSYINACQNSSYDVKRQCWEDSINEVAQLQGIKPSLNLLVAYSEKDPDFIRECHIMLHTIGKNSYLLYSQGKDFTIDSKVTYCTYGYYHGVMETILQKTNNDYSKARDFCSYINDQLKKEGVDLSSECYHGIGHGGVNDHDKKYWGDAHGLVNYAVDLCQKVSDTEERLEQCATGIFNGVGNFYFDGDQGLTINVKDPLWVCKEQNGVVKRACYALMSRVYLKITDKNLPKAISIAKQTVEPEYYILVVRNISNLYANIKSHTTTSTEIISQCSLVDKNLRESCLIGTSSGLLQIARPGTEMETLKGACENSLLSADEALMCYEENLPIIKKQYNKENFQTLCKQIDEKYQSTCN
jgi:hypothetical protein